MSSATLPQLILDVEVTGLFATIRFNDIAVSRQGGHARVSYAAILGGWAMRGANMLSVSWEPLRGSLRPPDPPPPPRLTVRLRRTVGETETELAHFERPAGPAAPGTFQHTISFEPPMVWSWTGADQLASLSPPDRDGIVAFLRQIHAALLAGDHARLRQAQTVAIGEQAIAAGVAAQTALDSYETFLTERMRGGGWRVAPFDPARLTFELMGQGRVVHVTGPGGEPFLVTHSHEGFFALDPYLSTFGGQWRLVR